MLFRSSSKILSVSNCQGRVLTVGIALLSVALTNLHASQPNNLALGLKQASQDYRAARSTGAKILTPEQFATFKAAHPLLRADTSDRVIVDVYLDGSVKPDDAAASFTALGCAITARADWFRNGAFTLHMPLEQAAKVARTAGVANVNLSVKPQHRVGLTTSQGVKALNATAVQNLGYLGSGVTVGVLSDSFDTAKLGTTQPTTNATQDAANDDLPGLNNKDGYTTPVDVLQDYGDAAAPGTDEGRAMLQIVHDMAPAASLAFATADESEIGFADNIIALAGPTTQQYTVPVSDPATGDITGTATINGGACKVICDDVGYYDEPMFSDGVVAQAIDQVALQNNVSYFSSAGNDGSSGYAATYTPVANTTTSQALLSSQGGITYSSLPATETSVITSFHQFGTDPKGNPILVQRVFIPKENGYTTATSGIEGVLSFQWDDPSLVTDANGDKQVTTDFDILVFTVANGVATYQATLSGTDTNVGSGGTNEPVELAGYFNLNQQYELVIVQTNRAVDTGVTANQATHIRWALETDANQIVADFNQPNSPESFGHNCAEHCNGAAAYVYDASVNGVNPNTSATTYSPAVEVYSSNGPSKIYFDTAGNRLSTPISRKQPTLSTVDGVDNTILGSDTDGDGYPNFYGTSAAAPHGAACAALLINAAANKGVTLGWADVRALLTSTTQGTQDLDPALSQGVAGPVTFQAKDRGSYNDPSAYNIILSPSATGNLTKLVFNLGTVTLAPDYFYTSTQAVVAGFSTVGNATTTTAPTFTSALSNFKSGSTKTGATETLTYTNFAPGDVSAFGVAIAPQAGGYYQRGDVLAGATFSATVNGTIYNGTLANTTGKQWNFKSGYGLVDVNAALTKLLGALH